MIHLRTSDSRVYVVCRSTACLFFFTPSDAQLCVSVSATGCLTIPSSVVLSGRRNNLLCDSFGWFSVTRALALARVSSTKYHIFLKYNTPLTGYALSLSIYDIFITRDIVVV